MSDIAIDKSTDITNVEFYKSNLYQKIISDYFINMIDLDKAKATEDLSKMQNDAADMLRQLKPNGPIQLMLAAQMLSVHAMQQNVMVYAKNANMPNHQQYYTNSAIKLSNLFVAQANLLDRLQNERHQGSAKEVHVHNGGQAVVGSINCYGAKDGKENAN